MGIFFTRPTDDKHMMDEDSSDLLQMNFFDIDLDFWVSDFLFSPLTKGLNHDVTSPKI
jgi:hypothetical protein